MQAKKIFYFFCLCITFIINNSFIQVTYCLLRAFLHNQKKKPIFANVKKQAFLWLVLLNIKFLEL